MKAQSAKASGKVMIAGEYAVLFGGISLVGAVERQAIASFEPGPDLDFSACMGASYEHNNRDELFLACLRAAKSLGLSTNLGSYRIDTSAFYNPKTHQKLGIGSSAAASVALCKLILAQNECHALEPLLKLALLAHKDFSGSLGSGADIAAAVFGEVIQYSICEAGPSIKALSLPWWPDLIWIDTLRSQNTRVFVAAVLHFAKIKPQVVADFKARSDYWTTKLVFDRFDGELAQALSELNALMKDLGERVGLDIISKEHQQIYDLAHSLGGSAKPSGAGGGDLCLAWVPVCKRASFFKHLAHLGFLVLTLTRGLNDQTLAS